MCSKTEESLAGMRADPGQRNQGVRGKGGPDSSTVAPTLLDVEAFGLHSQVRVHVEVRVEDGVAVREL